MIEEYFESIKTLLQSVPLTQSPQVNYDRRDRETGFVRGDLVFKDGSRLHFREFVQAKRGQPVDRYMYVFQYMRADGVMVFRYDNTKHFPDLPTAPHHKHVGEDEVIAANPSDLESVLREIKVISK